MTTARRLEADTISFAYELPFPVLNDVSVLIESGGITGIVGPNGSGKSTLLRVLSGILKPRLGRVLLDGKPLHAMRATARARYVAFLPQAVDPIFTLTVAEVVALGRFPHIGALARLSQHDWDVVARCMHDTDTDAFRDRDFLTLSGGERQRVLLASILAQEPDLLLLDEPTSALDIHHQVELFALLKRLTMTGYGVAVVTHDLNLAGRFCDSLLLLSHEHRPLTQGAPSNVLTASLLSEAYAAPIEVCAHPITGAPLVYAGETKP